MRKQNSLLSVQNFPRILGEFRYLRSLPMQKKSSYSFAEYVDKKGNSAICKLWTGKIKDVDFYSLCNEINIYKDLRIVIANNRVLDKYPYISIPNLYGWSIENESALILLENVKGKMLSELNPRQIVKSFDEIISFFDCITPLASKTLRFNKLRYFFLFHYYVFLSVIRNRLRLWFYIDCLFSFYSGYIKVIADKSERFVHRDLGYADNVIITNGKRYIIDFQLSGITNPVIEAANIIVCLRSNPRVLYEFFRSSEMQRILINPNLFVEFKAFLIYTILVAISMQAEEDKKELNITSFNTLLNHFSLGTI